MMLKTLKIVSLILSIAVLTTLALYAFLVMSERELGDESRQQAPGHFLATPLGKLHYQWFEPSGKSVSAPIIVMSHGFSSPSSIFTTNATALAKSGYRVLIYDHFGRGWSDRPSGPYNDSFYEEELNLLLNGLDIDQPIGLVGLSMGGLTSAYYAANNPQRISALFLFVPSGIDISGASDSVSGAILMTPGIGDVVWRLIAKNVIAGLNTQQSKSEHYTILSRDIAEQMQYKGYFQALLSSYRHMKLADRDEVYKKLSKTKLAVAAVFGGNDTTVLPSSADRLTLMAPNIDVSLIPTGGHGLNYQKPNISNSLLIDFFRTNVPLN